MMTERTISPQGPGAIRRRMIREFLEEEIQRSQKILDLEEDWDGDGACAYATETWQKAVFFLRNLIGGLPEHVLEIEASEELIPEILPGPHGSIDLEWEADRFDLLINIPKDGELASYYGDDYGENRIKGNLNISAPKRGIDNDRTDSRKSRGCAQRAGNRAQHRLCKGRLCRHVLRRNVS